MQPPNAQPPKSYRDLPPNHPVPLYAKMQRVKTKEVNKCKVCTIPQKSPLARKQKERERRKCKVQDAKYMPSKKSSSPQKKSKRKKTSMQRRVIPTNIPKPNLLLPTHRKPIPIKLRPIPINPRIKHTSNIHQLTNRMLSPIPVPNLIRRP